jgi:drug/metabolite transporter (DMT)-like permease
MKQRTFGIGFIVFGLANSVMSFFAPDIPDSLPWYVFLLLAFVCYFLAIYCFTLGAKHEREYEQWELGRSLDRKPTYRP